MLPAQRHTLILEHVRDEGGVSVRKLARKLGVSHSTIRRDLNQMDDSGMLQRVRGGASAGPSLQSRPRQPTTDADARIASKAATLVQDGHVVLLDSGPLTVAVAQALKSRPVTVVTASLPIADVLRADSVAELVVLGGVFAPAQETLSGPLTRAALGFLAADWAFLETSGVREDGTVFDSTGGEVSTKRMFMKHSARSYLLVRAKKIPGSGAFPVCRARDFGGIITDADPAVRPLKRLSKSQMEVLFV